MPGVTIVTQEMLEAAQVAMDKLRESDPYLVEQELAFRRHVEDARTHQADGHEPSGLTPGDADRGEI
jgi:hypothetical protein